MPQHPNWPKDCAAIIPCLNEAATIGSLVHEVRKVLPTVIVVDDGSGDETGKIAAEAGALVLRHDQPRGKGAALNSGWRHALSLGFQWALALDGDGQHSPADIASFLACAESSGARLVVGDRMANPKGMPWLRRQVNCWMSRQLTRLAGCRLSDTQCGFRLMNLNAWSKMQIETSHFEAESELLLAFAAAGHKIEFVPIAVIYQNEESKIRPLQDTWRWFRWLLKRRG
jgi:glycosyltransferase involved in cell wall biosynthesis